MSEFTPQPQYYAPMPPVGPGKQRSGIKTLLIVVAAIFGSLVLIFVALLGIGIAAGATAPLQGPTGFSLGTATPWKATGAAPFKFQGTYEAKDGKAPVRWPSCTTLTLVVDSKNMPKNGFADVEKAAVELSKATGLTVNVRSVDDLSTQKLAYGEIPISWPKSGSDVCEMDDALACAQLMQMEYPNGLKSIGSAEIFIYRDQVGDRVYPVLLHELAHAVGLDHVQSSSQLMNPRDNGATGFSKGDLAGLKIAGQGVC